MSFDLYLLPLQHDDSFDTAMALLDALEHKDPGYAYEFNARQVCSRLPWGNASARIEELQPSQRRYGAGRFDITFTYTTCGAASGRPGTGE